MAEAAYCCLESILLPGEGARQVVSLQLNMHSAGDVQVPILPGPFERAVHPARSVGGGRWGWNDFGTSRRVAVLTGEYPPFKMAFARDNCCSDNEMDGTPVTECM